MRRFDQSCLTPVRTFSAADIRALREREQVSQTVFAMYLNVTKGSVSQWERGDKRPAGPACKLFSIAAEKGLSAIA
jgi:putative transcriptional regulator